MFEPPLTPYLSLSLSLSLSLTQIENVYELTQCLSDAHTDPGCISEPPLLGVDPSCHFQKQNLSWNKGKKRSLMLHHIICSYLFTQMHT